MAITRVIKTHQFGADVGDLIPFSRHELEVVCMYAGQYVAIGLEDWFVLKVKMQRPPQQCSSYANASTWLSGSLCRIIHADSSRGDLFKGQLDN